MAELKYDINEWGTDGKVRRRQGEKDVDEGAEGGQ